PEVYFCSLLLLFPAPAIPGKRLPGQFVCSDHEQALRLWNVNHAKVSSRAGLPNGHPRAFPAWAILSWPLQNLHSLVFVDAVTMNMRFTGRRINIESNLHVTLYQLSYAARRGFPMLASFESQPQYLSAPVIPIQVSALDGFRQMLR